MYMPRTPIKTAPFQYNRGGRSSAYTQRVSGARLAAYAKSRAMGGSTLAIRRMRNPIYSSATAATRGWKNNNSELKYLDIASAQYDADLTGSVTALNLTAVGDDNTTRDGRQICNRSVHVQGFLRPETAGNSSVNLARLMLVWDSQPNSGAIATIANILTASTSVSNTNLDNRARFTILRDHMVAVGGQDAATATTTWVQSPTVSELDWFVPLRDAVTTYSGTTATIGVVATGALLLVTIGNQAANDGHNFFATTRLRFTDN